MSYLKSIKFPKKNINLCLSYSSGCVREVHSKPLVCLYLENQSLVFLGNLILLKAWYEDVAN